MKTTGQLAQPGITIVYKHKYKYTHNYNYNYTYKSPSLSISLSLYIYIYIYVHICVCVCAYVCIYIYIYIYTHAHTSNSFARNSKKRSRVARYGVSSLLLELCVSSLRRGHANLLCIVPILTDDPRRESNRPIRPVHLLRVFLQESLSNLSGRLPNKFNGHENSHPLELRVCLSQTL